MWLVSTHPEALQRPNSESHWLKSGMLMKKNTSTLKSSKSCKPELRNAAVKKDWAVVKKCSSNGVKEKNGGLFSIKLKKCALLNIQRRFSCQEWFGRSFKSIGANKRSWLMMALWHQISSVQRTQRAPIKNLHSVFMRKVANTCVSKLAYISVWIRRFYGIHHLK